MRNGRALALILPSLLLALPASAGRLERVLSQEGKLDKKDMTLPAGEFFEVFPVDLAAGDRVIAEMRSSKVDTYLVLKSPGGNVMENDDLDGDTHLSQIDAIVEETGTWLVYATTAGGGEKGAYTLTVSVDTSGRGQVSSSRPAAGSQALALGTPVQGSLSSGDTTLPNGEWADLYELQLQAGQNVAVDMQSGDLDTYLVLRSPAGEVFGNDDWEGQRSRSRVEHLAEETGAWTVYATTYEAGQGGSYTLSASLATAGADSSGTQRWSGALASGDRVLEGGELIDAIPVEGRTGERWVVDLRSTQFDPFLIVRGPDGAQVENDDFEGARDRSVLDLTLGMDGTYTIAVTTYQGGESGSYDLTLRRVDEDAQASGPQRHSGTLAAGDPVLGSGEWFDEYTFEGLPGQRVVVDMNGGFDTYLGLIGPGGFKMENDDGDGSNHSRIEGVLTEAGAYRVVATSYQPGQGGAYTLDIAVSQEDPADSANRDVVALAPGEAAVGTLADGDRTLDGGEYQDVYALDVTAGQMLSVSLMSSDFDPYLALILPDGGVVQNDDWEGSNQLSRIDLQTEQGGRYRVVATSYRPGSTGAYRLEASLGARSTPTATAAAPSGDGRTYGVFVGISDYPAGGPSDLDFTADDARHLYEGMQAIGMRAEDGRLLTDSQATRAGFEAALRELAPRMGPNDRLMIFYSGHGGRLDRSDFQAADPDGYDETLALYDGEIRDDEVAALLDQVVQQGTILLVLDSCFSGGFSKDVISRPGRMGLFSSHEDVTSAVARKFRAGGYLSRFMVEAIGERLADQDSSASLTALELSQYLYERYRSDVKAMPQEKSGAYSDIVMTGENLGYQQIIVDRGGVGPSQVLFAW